MRQAEWLPNDFSLAADTIDTGAPNLTRIAMPPRYPIPAARHTAVLVVQRSRFVATADHTPSVEAAKAMIDAIRRASPDASHHVHAFAIGHGSSVIHGAGDDGEPPGTAGRPTLAVVAGSGLGDVCVVTTRYFGGTKLGTGGLVRAYTEAAQAVLAEIPRTVREEKRTVRVTVAYGWYEIVARMAQHHGGEVLAQDFAEDVALTLRFPADGVDGFAAALGEATSGRVGMEMLED